MQINLISDTVTKPTPGMLDAMMSAVVGDDVFKEDPTVNALEEKVAKLFGMESALFFPSGTMTNQTAIKLHTQPGEQLICDKYAHIYNYEGGGVSFNSGVSCRLVDGSRGTMTAAQVESVINPPDFYHSPLTTLVCVENTANKGGGTCWNFQELEKIRKVCDEHHLGFHLDGARLWNAIVEKNETTLQYGQLFDTISVCLSKGLGCPVGSLLLGTKEQMDKAIRIRKIFGGGMRQSGFLAAAAIYALDNHIERLAEDHKKAQEIGKALLVKSFIKKVEPIETNIVIFEIDESFMTSDTFVNKLKEKDILIIGMGQGKLRMVTHLDYTDAMHDELLKQLAAF
ncbi:threonine aldolase family protein [Maribacter arcticus]|jgi:threonine aldolase|uniref:L-threonine aldolase n=1 Tax=Maribacter arcticus TaxID=561365 RepID=A0A1T5BEQ3_9FLAO|nr:GntG family PLP-dependent aldolase [Maribacter arcticus]SKB45323.1 L-threonine aldolase [Maribacter arcticus]|tara:strand:+ start:2789 stop:3811 length:1023 start_codon:yes stop_codon:yes gene_type:complete